MGRTVPSITIALAQERAQWKLYRQHLDKKQKKAFDEMFSIVRNYHAPCMMALVPIRIHLIIVSILFHHYLELERIEKSLKGPQR